MTSVWLENSASSTFRDGNISVRPWKLGKNKNMASNFGDIDDVADYCAFSLLQSPHGPVAFVWKQGRGSTSPPPPPRVLLSHRHRNNNNNQQSSYTFPAFLSCSATKLFLWLHLTIAILPVGGEREIRPGPHSAQSRLFNRRHETGHGSESLARVSFTFFFSAHQIPSHSQRVGSSRFISELPSSHSRRSADVFHSHLGPLSKWTD